MNIKPGDLFNWVYTNSTAKTGQNTMIFSCAMQTYVPTYGTCMCIGVHDHIFWWLHNGRVLCARERDFGVDINTSWRRRRGAVPILVQL